MIHNTKIILCHLRMIHVREKGGEYPCYLCEAVLNSKKDLRLHTIDRHKDDKSKVCPQCGSTFKIISSVRRHIKTVHEQTKQYVCSFCEKKYMHKYDLENHFQKKHNFSNNDEGRNVCPDCHLTFPSLAKLKGHMHSEHNKAIAYIKCPFCVKVFFDPIYLKQHCKKIHKCEPASLFVCRYCPVVCSCENTLMAHMNLVHSWTETNFCTRHGCNEYFQTEEEVTTHSASHPKQILAHKKSVFKCWECGKVYDTRNFLMSHFIEHHQTTSRKFECQCKACTYSLSYFTKKDHEVDQDDQDNQDDIPCTKQAESLVELTIGVNDNGLEPSHDADQELPEACSKKRKIVPLYVHGNDEFDVSSYEVAAGKKKRPLKKKSAKKSLKKSEDVKAHKSDEK